MRYSIAVAAAALAAPALADYGVNPSLISTPGKVSVINKCDYKVYLWNVYKNELGCPESNRTILEPGERWGQTMQEMYHDMGVSIKLSKSNECGKPTDITQLEYKINRVPGFVDNYHDVSFVDCPGGDCPGRDCFFMKSGNVKGEWATAGADKAICPELSCNSAETCAQNAYVGAYDVQTKSCANEAPLDLYLCQEYADGNEPAGNNDNGSYKPKPEQPKEEPKETPKQEEKPKPSPIAAEQQPEEPKEPAAYSPAPEVTQAPAPPKPNVKTQVEVVYVTQTEYAYEKRHSHAHAHNRRQFRA